MLSSQVIEKGEFDEKNGTTEEKKNTPQIYNSTGFQALNHTKKLNKILSQSFQIGIRPTQQRNYERKIKSHCKLFTILLCATDINSVCVDSLLLRIHPLYSYTKHKKCTHKKNCISFSCRFCKQFYLNNRSRSMSFYNWNDESEAVRSNSKHFFYFYFIFLFGENRVAMSNTHSARCSRRYCIHFLRIFVAFSLRNLPIYQFVYIHVHKVRAKFERISFYVFVYNIYMILFVRSFVQWHILYIVAFFIQWKIVWLDYTIYIAIYIHTHLNNIIMLHLERVYIGDWEK